VHALPVFLWVACVLKDFLWLVSVQCTWSFVFREELSLRVFENRVLRRIFGPKRDEVTGEWRKLHNEEINELYCSHNIVRVIRSRRMRWGGGCNAFGG